MSYSGGNEKSHYYISGGFLDQSGIVRSVGYRRFNFQANTDAQVTKWLKLSNNLTFSADEKKSGSYSIGDAMKALPVQPVKNADGTWSGPEGNAEWYGSIRNPIGTTEVNSNKTNGYNFLANITAEIQFAKWLKFRSTFGYDAKFWFDDNYTPKYDWKPTPVEESSRYKSTNKSFTYLWDNYFLFDYTIADDHNISVMAGMSAQWNDYDYYSAQKNVFTFENVHEFDNGQKMYSIRARVRQRTENVLDERQPDRVGAPLLHGPPQLFLQEPLPAHGHRPPRRLQQVRPEAALGYFPVGFSGLAHHRREVVS